ncbi:protein kinase domain-containing protein [Aquimonas voraii]|uniref:Serine/threonine protein kinase n=1 Tax=Aquimonas voraii TaxID=265719 RepID=A0A1G6Y0P4_9GAMM|nr:protein kinase [Aquimonas voraii]SDD84044.1 Serine/threonine protein kinase [Aquimonas voraii]
MATPTPTPDLSPDELSELLSAYMPDIPGYRVLRRLGQGGMSYVYLGVQESLDRQVAIKVIAPTALKDEISKLRFEREARTIAKLQHPAIVSIHDVGRTELGLLYYVMPFLPRGHLGQRELTEDEPRLIAILRALLWGLDYAHERGVVHRDIKSENVLFDNVDRPLLTDFGIAMHRGDRSRVTDGGFALGSATHMAPEQARGEKVDGRADLYSIGVLAYDKLIGELPFQAEGPLQMAVRHSVDPIPRLPPHKAHWQAFIDRALAKMPDARFGSAQEMMAALDRIEQARLEAGAPALPPDETITAPRAALPAAPKRAINPLFVASAALVVLVLALVVAWQAWNQRGSTAAVVDAIEAIAEPAATPTRAALPAPESAGSEAPAQAQITPATLPAQTPATALPSAGPVDVEGLPELSAGEPLEAAETADAGIDPAIAALPPVQQALHFAGLQIRQRRLTQPPGANAHESLLRAQALGAEARELSRLGEAWLAAAQPYVEKSFAAGAAEPDRRLHEAALRLAQALSLADSEAWQTLQQAPREWLRERLRAAHTAGDVEALRAARAQAQTLSIAAAALEPEWSRGIVQARVGQRLAGTPAQQLLRLPQGERPGLAGFVEPISRSDYARFVAATGRAAASCKIRSAAFNLRKRRWDAPGFDQAAAEPVVCVSLADAEAYAQWLGQQEGRRYRLPVAQEWQGLPVAAAAEACRTQPATCARPDQVREWSAPCADGCARQPLLGFGRREAEQPEREREAAVDPAHGYDDVGFRLVREVNRAELEQR